MSKHLQAHKMFANDKKNITIARPYLEFLNMDYYAAVVVRRIIGWCDWAYGEGRETGEFWKDEKEWLEEDGLDRRTINRGISVYNSRASEFLGREVEVIKKRVGRKQLSDGTYLAKNTTFYRIDVDLFEELWDMITPIYNRGELRGYDPKSGNDKNDVPKGDDSAVPGTAHSAVPLHIHNEQAQRTNTSSASDEAASAKADADETPKPKEEPYNGRLKWQQAKLVDSFYAAKGVPKKDISGQSRGQARNVLKQLPPQFDHEDVYAFVKYLETDDWWREPGRLSPSTVVSRLPEWAAKGRPEALAPQRAWEKPGGKIGASGMAELIREWDESQGSG